MRRNIPPLIQLQAFSAAARHLNFTRAGEEILLTQSAISRQMRALERTLGVVLFRRSRNGLELTSQGTAYLAHVRAGLEILESATEDLRARESRNDSLTLAILPTFGRKWLIPRLADFSRRHPMIVVNLVTRHAAFDFAAVPEIDAAIHFGPKKWPGSVAVQMDRLMGERTVVICSPNLLASRHAPVTTAELGSRTLLHHSTRPSAWGDWFAGAGIEDVPVATGPRYEHFDMTVQAAQAGLGFAVMPEFLLDGDLAEDRLVIAPGLPSVESRHAYYFVYSQGRSDRRPLRIFRKWLVKQAEEFIPPQSLLTTAA